MDKPLEAYGLIGDLAGSALVADDGHIDWLCLPRFDSDACFAAILGNEEHGTWSLAPTSPIRKRQRRYRPDTLILETDIECEGGKVRVIDFMPPQQGRHEVVRIVQGLEGTVDMSTLLRPRFGFGQTIPRLQPNSDGASAIGGQDALHLRTPCKLHIEADAVKASFQVKRGDRVPFVLAWSPSFEHGLLTLPADVALAETEAFWLNWVSHCTYQGRWRDAVVRSLITIKALTYAASGGTVAAATTSLPEEIGGVRNWDYRFCWLRDSSLMLAAMMNGGYQEEAIAWRDWLLRAAGGAPEQVQIMYGVGGERRLTEAELPWLPGYANSKPVRVGNAAYDQFQLDVYGSVLACAYRERVAGAPDMKGAWNEALRMIHFVEEAWQRPDEGIWEVRTGCDTTHFTYSKVQAWVAMNCAIKLSEEFGVFGADGKAQLERWKALRERIAADVMEKGFDAKRNTFTQSYGSAALDASVLTFPLTGFIAATDPRMKGTIAAVEQGLIRDGFVRRYATEDNVDGLPGDEGSFLLCSFWLVENYALAGRTRDAEELFERLLNLRNDLGLLAEMVDPHTRRQIGNFPQAYSHMGLVDAACRIEAITKGAPLVEIAA